MKDQLKQILESLPEKPPRSRLAPYREFIGELRRLGRTYRDIAAILAEECQLRVSASTIHGFVRKNARAKTRRRKNRPDLSKRHTRAGSGPRGLSTDSLAGLDEVQQRIAVLKHRRNAIEPEGTAFQFDPTEPLRLK